MPSPNAYDPQNFWGVAFARSGSAVPKVKRRAFALMPVTITVCLLDHFDLIESDHDFSEILPVLPALER